MKILYVQKIKAFAGSEKYFTEIMPQLIKNNVECELLCVVIKEDLPKLEHFFNELKKRTIPYHTIITTSDFSIGLLRKINQVLESKKFDLIHTHLIHAELWLSIIKLFSRKKIPLVSTIHGYDEKHQEEYGFSPTTIQKTKYYYILKFCSRYIDRYFAVSNGLKNLVTKGGIIPENKVDVIHHGFDYPPFDVTFTNQTIKKGSPQILVPGRVIPYKGQNYVVEAISLLQKKYPEIHVWFAGDFQGPFGDQLIDMVKKRNLDKNCTFLGHISNLPEYYAQTDMIIIPSKCEGFGLVFLEAYNSRKPIIAFDVPASNEIILHKETGYLIPPFDHEELANTIDLIVKSPEISKEITSNGNKRLSNYFCSDRMIQQTINFYQNATKEH